MSGSTPVATGATTYVNDLPDYVKPYYQLLLNADTALAFDPAYIQQQLPTLGYVPPSGGAGSSGSTPGGLGSIVGHGWSPSPIYGTPTNPNLPTGSGSYNNGIMGMMSLPSTGGVAGQAGGSQQGGGYSQPYGQTFTIDGTPVGAPPSQIGTGTSGNVAGGVGYKPGTGAILYPTPIPIQNNGSGAPSGHGTGGFGGVSGGIPSPAPIPVVNTHGSIPVLTPAQSANYYGKYQSAANGNIYDTSGISQTPTKGGRVGTSTITTPNGTYVQHWGAVDLPDSAQGHAEGGVIGMADGGAYMTSGSAYPGTSNPWDPWNPFPGGTYPGGFGTGDPTFPTIDTGGYYGNSQGGNYGGTSGGGGGSSSGGSSSGSTSGTGSTGLQGSYPFAQYTPYNGQRLLDPTGMFGFNPSSNQPYGLSSPTQFYENQSVYGYTNPDGTFKAAPLDQAKSDINQTFEGAQSALGQAQNTYQNLWTHPLQSTYHANTFSVNPLTSYQVSAPGSVSPDLSGFSSANTPQIGQYDAVSYGVTPGNWTDSGTAASYMSPYLGQVDQAQQALINRNFDEQQAANHANAALAGAYGGTRQAVQDSLSNRDRQMQLDAVAAQNLNNAYNTGAQQFNADRGAQMQAGQYGLQADLANQNSANQIAFANQQALLGSRNTGASLDLQAQLANQQAGLGAGEFNANLANQTQNQQIAAQLQAAGMTNQSQLSADQQAQAAFLNQQNALNANLGQQYGALGIMGSQGPNLGNMENLQQQLDMQRLQQIGQVGQTEDQRRQQILDLGYQNFVNQQNWPYQLANFYSGQLRGVPTQVNSEGFQYQSQNPAQWLGLGLAGLGATTGGYGSSGSTGGYGGIYGMP